MISHITIICIAFYGLQSIFLILVSFASLSNLVRCCFSFTDQETGLERLWFISGLMANEFRWLLNLNPGHLMPVLRFALSRVPFQPGY